MKVDELSFSAAIELSTGSGGFYSKYICDT